MKFVEQMQMGIESGATYHPHTKSVLKGEIQAQKGICMNKKKKRSLKWKNLTLDERFTMVSLIVIGIFLTMNYVLAFLGKEPMESVASVLVIDGAMVLIKYSIKSFKAKQSEENLKYKKLKDGVEDIVTVDEVFEEIGDM